MNKQYIRFTGAYRELKNMGFEFQKLFARNHMQWSNGDVHVWKCGAEVTLSALTNYEGPAYALISKHIDNLPFEQSKYSENTQYLNFYINTQTHEVTFDETDYIASRKALFAAYNAAEQAGRIDPAEIIPNLWRVIPYTPETIEPLLMLHRKGWLEVAEWES